MNEYGIKTQVKEYFTLLSKPILRKVAIVEPMSRQRTFTLMEDEIHQDSCTKDKSALPPFIAYSGSGDVKGKVVYLNYGRQKDFELAVKLGVVLKGRIALVRYGDNYRGIKVMLAEEYGMVGVIVYSDPMEDGFARGKVYPDGPWRPSSSVQRGSGQFISLYSGDPQTPGYASTMDAPRVPLNKVSNIPHIPVQPMSYGDAIHLLQGLEKSPLAPKAWQGALDVQYRMGPGDMVVHMHIIVENKPGKIWNVIGTIEGFEEPQRYVILGT